jgi:hypothetical protein
VILAFAVRTAAVLVGICSCCGAFVTVPTVGIIGVVRIQARDMDCVLIGPVVGLILGTLGAADTGRSNPAQNQQYDEDDHDYPDDTDPAVTVAVAVTAEAATEATKQKDDEDNDEYKSERHGLTPLVDPDDPSSPMLMP